MEDMKNWKVGLTTGGKNLSETNIQRGIFLRETRSQLKCVIAMMPLSHILRKCTGGYNFLNRKKRLII